MSLMSENELRVELIKLKKRVWDLEMGGVRLGKDGHIHMTQICETRESLIENLDNM